MAERSPDANSDKSEFKTKGGVRVKGDLANFKAALEAKQSKGISGGSENPGGAGPSDSGESGDRTKTVYEPGPLEANEPLPPTPDDQADAAPSSVRRRRDRRDSIITGEGVDETEGQPKKKLRKKSELAEISFYFRSALALLDHFA